MQQQHWPAVYTDKDRPNREVMCLDAARYSILAPNAIPAGFVDGKVVTEKVLLALALDQNEYRLGHTKVFFRAGVLGMLEDMRDERLSKIIANFQARIRGYIIRQNYKKLQEQRYIFNSLLQNPTVSNRGLWIVRKILTNFIVNVLLTGLTNTVDGAYCEISFHFQISVSGLIRKMATFF